MTIKWKNDPAYELNAAALNQMLPDVFAFGTHYLEKAAAASIKILANTKFMINNSGVFKVYDVGAADITLTAAHLDTGAFVAGNDYYVYLCDAGVDAEVYLISLNSSYPAGYNANNSRKIGGFHYGWIRNSRTVADVSVAVVPNSVWDLKWKPAGRTPEGMAYITGTLFSGQGYWCDIYLSSVGEAITFQSGSGSPLLTGTGLSRYNAVPLTGTEGLSGYNFIEMARRSGKRLLTYTEWLAAADGHPAGDQYAGNVSTRGVTAEDVLLGSISLQNIIDCSRKVYQWAADFTIRQDSTAWAWQNPMAAMNVGQLYLPNGSGISQILAGGYWGNGAVAGCRCAYLDYYPWSVGSSLGSRFACD